MKKSKLSLLMSFAISFGGVNAHACKDLIYPSNLPKSAYEKFSDIYIADVDEIIFADPKNDEGPYKAKLRIVESLKGEQQPGAVIHAASRLEEPHARCPVEIISGQKYLIFLDKKNRTYEIPLYGVFTLDSLDPIWTTYVRDVKSLKASASK